MAGPKTSELSDSSTYVIDWYLSYAIDGVRGAIYVSQQTCAASSGPHNSHF